LEETENTVTEPSVDLPAHNYSQEEKGVYYYVTAVSDNDKANGKGAGDALGFKYLGTNDNGEYVVASVEDDGEMSGKAFCRNPCTIVRFSSGQKIGYSPDSVIGAVFADVFAGQLKEADRDSAKLSRDTSSTHVADGSQSDGDADGEANPDPQNASNQN